MKSLYEKEVLNEITARLNKIAPETKPLWGKMNAAQMLEHCALVLDYATGKSSPPRSFIGLVMGPFFKSLYYSDKPFGRNSPTAKNYIVTNLPEYEKSKSRLMNLVHEFSSGGQEKATTHPSPFFGSLTQDQHGLGQFKHIDHHLRQFGV